MKELQGQRLHRVQNRRREEAPGALYRNAGRNTICRRNIRGLRKAMGNDVDIAIDFHGAISPATAKLLIKALEPYQPMFIEEPARRRIMT